MDVHPLVGPAKGDGDLGPGAIAGVCSGVFRIDGEHPAGGELQLSFAFSGGNAPEDGGDHLVVILEGIIVAPRWSTASSVVVVDVIQLFSLELLSQAKVVLLVVLAILVERARTLKDLLVLLIIVVLGVRFINSNNDVVWSAVAILTRFGPFWPITATVPLVTVVIVAAVPMALVVGSLIAAASWAMSSRILIEAHFGLFDVSVLISSRNHLANSLWRLAIELGAEVAGIESSDEGGYDLSFRDVRNRVPHLRKASDVATDELGWLLVDAVQIMLGARPSTRSHIVVGEDFFLALPRIRWSLGQGR